MARHEMGGRGGRSSVVAPPCSLFSSFFLCVLVLSFSSVASVHGTCERQNEIRPRKASILE